MCPTQTRDRESRLYICSRIPASPAETSDSAVLKAGKLGQLRVDRLCSPWSHCISMLHSACSKVFSEQERPRLSILPCMRLEPWSPPCKYGDREHQACGRHRLSKVIGHFAEHHDKEHVDFRSGCTNGRVNVPTRHIQLSYSSRAAARKIWNWRIDG